jgi:hypothetical protein
VGNSGKYYHLPPRYKLALNAIEISENAFVRKLEERNVVAVKDPSEPAKDAPKPKSESAKTADKLEAKSEASGRGKR